MYSNMTYHSVYNTSLLHSIYVYRQAVLSTVTVWNNVTNITWMFMKEISSDGDGSTVSVSRVERKYFKYVIIVFLIVSVNK